MNHPSAYDYQSLPGHSWFPSFLARRELRPGMSGVEPGTRRVTFSIAAWCPRRRSQLTLAASEKIPWTGGFGVVA